MFIYSFVEYYNRKRAEYEILKDRLKSLEPHSVISRRRGSRTYYYELKYDKGIKHERSIRKAEFVELSQKNAAYHECVRDLEACESFLRVYKKRMKTFYDDLCDRFDDRAKIVKLAEYRQDMSYRSENLIYESRRGDFFRSKSEVLIADVLYANDIYYEYEPKGIVEGVLPDFYIPDSIRGYPVIWEHFGKMNDFKYMYTALNKIGLYEQAGFYLNYNLIVTFELYSPGGQELLISFDSKQADNIVRNWFLPPDTAA